MRDLTNLLEKIPDEYKPLAAGGIGAVTMVGIVVFHGACLHRILIQYKRGDRRLRLGRPHVIGAMLLVVWSIFLMLMLHIAEIGMWAAILDGLGLIKRASDAVYFCANAYSTLGLSKMDLAEEWRNISPIIAISGLFTFAWTTSAAVDVLAAHGRLVDQLEEEREQEMHMRFAARKEAWDALKEERRVEQAEREKTRVQAAGKSFFERRKIWKEQKQREAELRRARVTAILEVRRKERLEEEKLGTGEAPADSQDKK